MKWKINVANREKMHEKFLVGIAKKKTDHMDDLTIDGEAH
jgi:hypothetical protein